MSQDRRSSAEHRVNERIRSNEVRVIGPDGDQLGVLKTVDAMAMAEELDLDLVEVAPTAEPPVCRILDYGKFKYQESIRAKEARKKQSSVVVKEIRFRPKIGTHDYETKKGHMIKFLGQGNRVKAIVWFRGREMAHTDLGNKILQQLTKDLHEVAVVEQYPKLDGRNMTMMFAPVKRTKDPARTGGAHAEDEAK
ncbi:MAG TPA: translation initiation factor IF-3 [Actinomycetota bacterium]|nr:translation initiation factor IF-3 [Actinomycetota bacterium]